MFVLEPSKAAFRPVLNAKDTFKPVKKEEETISFGTLVFAAPNFPPLSV